MAKKVKETSKETRPENVLIAYRDRLKLLRQAQEYSAAGDLARSVERYTQYLAILSLYHNVEEKKLSPKLFDQNKELTEMLLISNAYWALAKAFDRSPKLQKECIGYIKQFVTFSLGYKYQHVNAQMLKKFVRSRKAHNKKAFNEALDKLNVESKSCFLATHAFPENEFQSLTILRDFKSSIMKYRLGKVIVCEYYSYSPKLVTYLENSVLLDLVFGKFLLKPIILGIVFFLRIVKYVLN